MFSSSHLTLFLVFVFAAYLIAIDNSVAAAVNFISRLIKVEYEKRKWWFLNNPRNPIVKYLMWRRSCKLAKELQREFNSNAK
jgi:hypothetical protein